MFLASKNKFSKLENFPEIIRFFLSAKSTDRPLYKKTAQRKRTVYGKRLYLNYTFELIASFTARQITCE